jgi:protein TonB
VILHATVITLVAAVTAQASDRTPRTRIDSDTVIYVRPVPRTQPEHRPTAAPPSRAPNPYTIPAPPITHIEIPHTIPDGIPPVDLSILPVDASSFVSSSSTADDSGTTGDTRSNDGYGALSAWQVDRAVIPLDGNPKPEYPSMLQSGRVDGRVMAQFVVDTTGRVDMSTFSALEATNELFVRSVRRALSEWRFRPAEADGRRVRQLVEMPLVFKVK